MNYGYVLNVLNFTCYHFLQLCMLHLHVYILPISIQTRYNKNNPALCSHFSENTAFVAVAVLFETLKVNTMRVLSAVSGESCIVLFKFFICFKSRVIHVHHLLTFRSDIVSF